MQSDQERLDGLMQKARAFSEKQIQELEAKVSALRARINGFLDERDKLSRGVMSKEETKEKAILRLTEGRNAFRDLLASHLKDFQVRKSDFLQPELMRLFLANERNLPLWLYAVVTDEDIEAVAASLPSIGLGAEEREARIDAINKKVKALEQEVEKLLS